MYRLLVTDDGRLLARIYSESDLLVAECLRGGVWDGLNPAELAAVVSSVLYESREVTVPVCRRCRAGRPPECDGRWPRPGGCGPICAPKRCATESRCQP